MRKALFHSIANFLLGASLGCLGSIAKVQESWPFVLRSECRDGVFPAALTHCTTPYRYENVLAGMASEGTIAHALPVLIVAAGVVSLLMRRIPLAALSVGLAVGQFVLMSVRVYP